MTRFLSDTRNQGVVNPETKMLKKDVPMHQSRAEAAAVITSATRLKDTTST